MWGRKVKADADINVASRHEMKNIVVGSCADAKVDRRMQPMKPLNEIRKKRNEQAIEGGDMDAARILSLKVAEIGLHYFEVLQRLLGVAQHDFPGRRKAQTVGKALE